MHYCSAGAMLLISVAGQAQNASTAPAAPAVRAASVVRADSRTGRLIRTVQVMPAPRPAAASATAGRAALPAASPATGSTSSPAKTPAGSEFASLRDLVDREVEGSAARHGVDPALVHSVIRVESNYNPVAVSPKGAEGLMQLIPATARRFGASNSFDVRENIDAGVKYLKYLMDMFGDDKLAIAAYNAGESAVLRYGNVPPYPETVDYVYRVGRALERARQNAPAPAAAAPAAPQTPPGPPPARPVETYLDEQGRICIRTR